MNFFLGLHSEESKERKTEAALPCEGKALPPSLVTSHQSLLSKSKSRMGLPAGASLAFFIASSKFFSRMSSLFVSWNQEFANLSSTLAVCSARSLRVAKVPRFGAGLDRASCESTAPENGSTVSFAWQARASDVEVLARSDFP